MEQQAEHGKRRRGRKSIVGMILLLLLGAAGASGFWFWKYQTAVSNKPGEEQRELVALIEKTVLLPSEEPELSTVNNAAKLTNTTLKARTQNGDKLLVYPKAKRLIIYRPSIGKVVDILSIQTPSAAGAATPPVPAVQTP